MKPLKYKLLERIYANPGLNLKDAYRPFLKDYSESSIYSILKFLKEEGLLEFDRQSNKILVFPPEVSRSARRMQ